MSNKDDELSGLVLLYERINELQENKRNNWLGKLLTLVDATFQDPEQRKAQKDLVKEIFYGREYYTEQEEWNFRKFGEAINMEFYKNRPVCEEAATPEGYNPYIKK
jgi:hypothetical protein